MRIVVIGGGAMGMIHAALLSKVASVHLLVRRDEQVQAIAKDGLTVIGGDGARNTYTVGSTTDVAVLDSAELILVAVKSYQTPEVAKLIAISTNNSSLVVSIQNGFGHDELLVDACSAERVLLGKTGYAGGRVSDSVVQLTATGETVFGERDGPITDRVRGIEQVFRDAKVRAIASDQMSSVLWSKFAQACSQNGLSAITGKVFSELHVSESARGLLRLLSEEMKTLAAAERVPLLFDPYERLIANWDGLHHRSSMLQDLEAGRRTEIDAINGAAVRIGERHGLDMPTNRAVYLFVKTMETRR